jgi:hypothetical protein
LGYHVQTLFGLGWTHDLLHSKVSLFPFSSKVTCRALGHRTYGNSCYRPRGNAEIGDLFCNGTFFLVFMIPVCSIYFRLLVLAVRGCLDCVRPMGKSQPPQLRFSNLSYSTFLSAHGPSLTNNRNDLVSSNSTGRTREKGQISLRFVLSLCAFLRSLLTSGSFRLSSRKPHRNFAQ